MKQRIALVVALADGAISLNGCVVVGTSGNNGNGGAGGIFLFFLPLFLFVLIARLVRSGRRRRVDFRYDNSSVFEVDEQVRSETPDRQSPESRSGGVDNGTRLDGHPDAFGRETPRGNASNPESER